LRRLLLDTNVLMDVLRQRDPHFAASFAIWRAVENGKAVGIVAAHAFPTVFYLSRKSANPYADLDTLHRLFEVAPVNGTVLADARALGWTDYEDAVTAAAARCAGCDAIVTRDARDFDHHFLPVLDPVAALALVNALP
jgi:predicted nucleic acid-binding protein